MPSYIISLTLFAAFLHASWNALLRAGVDKLWSMTVMCVAVAGGSALGATFLAPPARISWNYAVISAVLHVGYNLFLVRSYRDGDFGQTYPVARGTSPVLVTLASAIIAGEWVGGRALIGIALVSSGIISLAFQWRIRTSPSLRSALGTGCFIAAYSVTDGIGVRLSGAPLAYTFWMCALWGVLMPAVYIGLRGVKDLVTPRPGFITSMAGGIVSLLAYGLVIYAIVARADGGGVGLA